MIPQEIQDKIDAAAENFAMLFSRDLTNSPFRINSFSAGATEVLNNPEKYGFKKFSLFEETATPITSDNTSTEKYGLTPLAVSDEDVVYVPISVEKELPKFDEESSNSITVTGIDDTDNQHWCHYDYTTNEWEGDGFTENTIITSWLKPVKLSELKQKP